MLNRTKERGVAPNSVTYTVLFDACQDDPEFLMQVFEECIRDGMLDEKLEHSFRDLGPECLRDQLKDGNIPSQWSQNANRGHGGQSWNQRRGT